MVQGETVLPILLLFNITEKLSGKLLRKKQKKEGKYGGGGEGMKRLIKPKKNTREL